MAQKTLELLEALITGHEMDPGGLDEFLSEKLVEDLNLEYTHGKELEDEKSAGRTIRQHLSGFGNSAGGVLLVGIEGNDWSVTGCSAPGGGDLAQWASRCLIPIAPYFSPVPSFCVVKHQRGDVLVASSARSVGLVPSVEGGKTAYYLRIHDQTLEAPDYLVGDLTLGRRQGPYLQIASFGLSAAINRDSQTSAYDLVFVPTFSIENESLAWAEDVRLGIISLVNNPTKQDKSLGSHLLSYVDVRAAKREKFGSCETVHSANEIAQIEPFQVCDVTHEWDYRFRLSRSDYWRIPYIWRAAIYIMAKGIPPIWYQLRLTVTDQLVRFMNSNAKGITVFPSSEGNFIEIRRLSGQRPVVALESI